MIRVTLRAFLLVLGLAVASVLVLLALAWEALGARPSGARLERMQASPQWSDRQDRFANGLPPRFDFGLMRADWGSDERVRIPTEPVPTNEVGLAALAEPPESGLRVTWFGHSSMLVELGDVDLLIDPIWGERASPFTWWGPRRYFPPLVDLEDLPVPDAVLISHDHYDHLDLTTVLLMRGWDTTFVVPLGVGAHLEYWGVPVERIVELDWWERHAVGDVEVVATPARHMSGRDALDRARTLWAGYAMLGPERRVYFSGDTGMFPELAEIGERLGPFDLTMIDAGQYGRGWPDVHLGPEQAVEAHRMVRGEVMMPVHWALFSISSHTWTAPIERVVSAARRVGVTVITPRPGDTFDPLDPDPPDRWWPDLPYRDLTVYPIVPN